MLKKKILSFFKKGVVSENSRTFRRMRSFCLIKYSLASDIAQKRIIVNARDISAGGTVFISKTRIPNGAVLEMDIQLPPLKESFTVMAKVVESLKVKGEEQYLIRTHFKAIDPEDRKRINNYIEQVAKDPSMWKYFDKKATKFKRRTA